MTLPEDLQIIYDKLTDKQKRFVDLWTGDGTETAMLVGYSTPDVAATRCLKKVSICKLIKFTRDAELAPLIATRKERQELWTTFSKDDELKPMERLKASELLGKSQGDFIDKLSVVDDRPDIPDIAAELTEKDLKDICKHALG